MQATQSVKWDEMYKWKDDMKQPGYEPKANVDHTISSQATPFSTLDHLVTTPRAMCLPLKMNVVRFCQLQE